MRRWCFILLGLAACAPAPTPGEDFNLAMSTRDATRALELLDRAIAVQPRPEYLIERARIHLALQQTREALADYDAALQVTRSDALGPLPRARLLFRRAQLYVALGRGAEAEADLDEVLQIAPEYTEALLERAWLRRKLKRFPEAQRDVEAARKSGAWQADYFYNEGVRALRVNDKPEADRMIDFALDLDPGHSRAHVARARLCMERGRFEEAAKELDLAIPVHPAEADLYYYRGTALLTIGKAEPALKDFETASELDPKEPIYLAARGLAKYRANQDVDAARADFDAAIRVDAACYPAWFNRGLIAYERKELEAAEKDFRQATGIHASPEGSIALGRVLQDKGETDMALDFLRRALEIFRAPEAQKALREEIDRMQRAKETKP
jgi:tetratricopeptide (TPR) repeat protein